MKSQRSFVVERKSSRRRQKAGATPSIWGDTDFKALAREVEVHVPQVFEEQQTSAAPTIAAPPVEETLIEVLEPSDHPSAATPADEPVDAVQSVQTVETRRASRQRATARQPSRSNRKTASSSVEEPVAAVMSFGALMELEDANRMLMTRWRGKLEVEHAQLVQMLQRVGHSNSIG